MSPLNSKSLLTDAGEITNIQPLHQISDPTLPFLLTGIYSDRQLTSLVTLKCVLCASYNKQEQRAIETEAMILNRLHGIPRIPKFFAKLSVESTIYPARILVLVTEFQNQPSLADAISSTRTPPATPNRRLSHARDFLETLAAIHESSVLHRALKPENVLYSDERGPTISNFGNGVIVPGQLDGQETYIRSETPAYLPPECVLAPGRKDAFTYYRVSEVLDAAYTTAHFLAWSDLSQVRDSVAQKTANSPNNFWPDFTDAIMQKLQDAKGIPIVIQTAIYDALAPDHSRRTQTIADLLSAFQIPPSQWEEVITQLITDLQNRLSATTLALSQEDYKYLLETHEKLLSPGYQNKYASRFAKTFISIILLQQNPEIKPDRIFYQDLKNFIEQTYCQLDPQDQKQLIVGTLEKILELLLQYLEKHQQHLKLTELTTITNILFSKELGYDIIIKNPEYGKLKEATAKIARVRDDILDALAKELPLL